MSMYPFTLGAYYLEDKPYFNPLDDEFAALGWFASADQIPEHMASPAIVWGTRLLKMARRTLPLSIPYTPGTYFWVLTLLVGFVLDERSLRGVTFCSISPLIMLEAVLVAAPCGSVRYALPLVYSLPPHVAAPLGCRTLGGFAPGAPPPRGGGHRRGGPSG